jgi:hypothetical protein
MIERVARFLESRSIALVVVPVPDKSRLAAPHLCGIERAPALADRLRGFVAGLKARNIKAVDLLPAPGARDSEGYYRTDTHWNEQGARRVAEAIAADLRRWGLAPAAQLTFEVTAETGRERVGDLIRLAGLDQVPRPMRPRGDFESPVRIKAIARHAVGILDDFAAPEVTVIGTSFSRRGGFIGFMSLVLAAPVANMAQDGGGVFTAAIDYFRNPAFTETPPRVIVWEIPERLLDEPITASDEQWAAALAAPLARWAATGKAPERGNDPLSGRYACYNVYEARDGRWLAVGALEPKFWAVLCRRLGCEDLIPDQFAEGTRGFEILARLTEIFGTRSASEWFELLRDDDCCVTPVLRLDEVYPRPVPDAPAPALGEHTREMMARAGYSEAEIGELVEARVIQA